jgi:hypothetical protein
MIIPITSQSELNKYYHQYHGGGWHEMPKYPARTFTGSAIGALRFKAFTKKTITHGYAGTKLVFTHR